MNEHLAMDMYEDGPELAPKPIGEKDTLSGKGVLRRANGPRNAAL